MKAVLASLKPYFYYLVGEGIKGVEVRKTFPKAVDWNKDTFFYMSRDERSFAKIPKEFQEKYRKHFGKVGLRFVCDKIYILSVALDPIDCSAYFPDGLDHTEGTCLTKEELAIYLCGGSWSGNGYGLNITDLVVYDEPRELGEFKTFCKSYYEGDKCEDCKYFIDGRGYEYDESDCGCNGLKPITRPPQSWCYCEEVE